MKEWVEQFLIDVYVCGVFSKVHALQYFTKHEAIALGTVTWTMDEQYVYRRVDENPHEEGIGLLWYYSR